VTYVAVRGAPEIRRGRLSKEATPIPGVAPRQ
jgi:hypothetical protein